jgi:Uma2 family endonuclease
MERREGKRGGSMFNLRAGDGGVQRKRHLLPRRVVTTLLTLRTIRPDTMAPEVLQKEKQKQQEERYTREEYLALDLDAGEGEGVKYEYDGAHVYLMAGASMEHNQIAGNVHTALNTRLMERSGRVLPSDQRVHLPDGRYTYPDVVALCGEPELTDERPPSLLNPKLIVEVASDSTAERDRTWKPDRYLALDSLREYWILESDAPRLQQYVRSPESDGGEWIVRPLSGADAELRREAFGLDVPVEELYRLALEA